MKSSNKTVSLKSIRLASPCDKDWDKMPGDERVRFCEGCSKNVYNISDMTKGEAEEFLSVNGVSKCMRVFRRHDGTVITDDCPVGLRKVRNAYRRFARSAAAILGLCVSVCSAFAQVATSKESHSTKETWTTLNYDVEAQVTATPIPPVITGAVDFGGFRTENRIDLKVSLPAEQITKQSKVRNEELSPNFRRAVVAELEGAPEQAIALYERAIKDDPKFVSSYNNLAQCLAARGKAGDRARAGYLLEQAEKISPQNPATGIANSLAFSKYDDRIIELSDASLMDSTPDPGIIRSLSEAHLRLSDPRRAFQILWDARAKTNSEKDKKVFSEAIVNLREYLAQQRKQDRLLDLLMKAYED